MRTTIYLPEDLLAEAKKVAAKSHRPLTAIIEEALREKLMRRKEKKSTGFIHLTTFGESGLQAGIDIDDTSSLLDLMEQRGVPG
jgi:predicted transcriptional regulator